MKKILLFFKSGFKYIVFFILGIIVASSGVFAAVTITASNVNYDNSSSGLSSTNVQSAIDELNGKADIRKVLKFVAAYTYSTSSSNKCITGEELTCEKTTCYQQKTSGSCPAGTIVKYKVNDTTIMNFHVMFDKGSTMVMQTQRNVVYNTMWVSKNDYVKAGGTESDYGMYGNHNKGPLTILPAVERLGWGWSNVNNLTYTAGTTTLYNNSYTGCSSYSSCTTNKYTMASRTAKARLITLQEIRALGCTETSRSCPIWLYNYLNNSTSYGGTVNDTSVGNNSCYWTMSVNISDDSYTWYVYGGGNVSKYFAGSATCGARAVVEVSK